jgi:hypothetical protein
MNLLTLVRIETGIKFQGFIDRDVLTHGLNFYYFDEYTGKWESDTLLKFKPVAQEVKETKVIGG